LTLQRIDRLGAAVSALAVVAGLLMSISLFNRWTAYVVLAMHFHGSANYLTYLKAQEGLPQLPGTAAWIGLLVGTANTALFLRWVRRARENAAMLAPQGRFRFTSRSSAGSFLVPFANLLWCRRIIDDIWRASRPSNIPAGPSGTVRSWQICLVGAVGLLLGVSFIIRDLGPRRDYALPIDGDTIAVTLVVNIIVSVALLLVLAAAILLVKVVMQISKWQVGRHPVPIADLDANGRAGGPVDTRLPILLLVSCGVATLLPTVTGLDMLLIAIMSGMDSNPISRALSILPLIGSLIFLPLAVVMASALIRMIRNPGTCSRRMTGVLCSAALIELILHILFNPVYFTMIRLWPVGLPVAMLATLISVILLERMPGGPADDHARRPA
jgi:hypothetical protein